RRAYSSRLRSSGSGSRYSAAFSASQRRTSARNAASSGVSLKSMAISGSGSARGGGQQPVAPGAEAADAGGEQPRPLVEKVAVGLPGVADAAVHLEVLLRGEIERLGGGDPRQGGGQRQLRRLLLHRPGAVP